MRWRPAWTRQQVPRQPVSPAPIPTAVCGSSAYSSRLPYTNVTVALRPLLHDIVTGALLMFKTDISHLQTPPWFPRIKSKFMGLYSPLGLWSPGPHNLILVFSLTSSLCPVEGDAGVGL